MGRLFEEVKACLSMRQVAEYYGYKPNKGNMIHSPFNPNDKNPSCKLYDKTFYDFSTGIGGDLIRFVSLLLQVDNWQATQELINAFHLPFSSATYVEHREEIERRLQQQKQAQEKEERFKRAVIEKIESEIAKERLYKSMKAVFEPLSFEWCITMNQLEMTKYRLDTLVTGSRQEQEQILNERRWTS